SVKRCQSIAARFRRVFLRRVSGRTEISRLLTRLRRAKDVSRAESAGYDPAGAGVSDHVDSVGVTRIVSATGRTRRGELVIALPIAFAPNRLRSACHKKSNASAAAEARFQIRSHQTSLP